MPVVGSDPVQGAVAAEEEEAAWDVEGDNVVDTPLSLRGPEEFLLLRAPGDDAEDAHNGNVDAGGGSAATAPSLVQSRPKRAAATRIHTFEAGESDEESDSNDPPWDGSDPPRNEQQRTRGSRSSPAAATPTAASSEPSAAERRRKLRPDSVMETVLRRAHVQTPLPDVKALSSAHALYDIDGYGLEFHGEGALKALEDKLFGRMPIHSIGAEWAKNRMLYDPDRFAMVGLSQPEKRWGMGLCVSRNAWGFSLADVGQAVIMPPGAPHAGERVKCTVTLVDAGCQAMHTFLSDESKGEHYCIKGLKRLDPGSHAIWRPHPQVMMYKLVHAAANLGLSVKIFDFGQKAKCAHPRPRSCECVACGIPLSPRVCVSSFLMMRQA